MMNINDRIQRLTEIFSKNELSNDFPLVKEIRIEENRFSKLISSLNVYIYDALSYWFKDFKYNILDDSFIDRNLNKIVDLPNITPNGLILPKKQTQLTYNLLQKSVISWFEDLKLSSYIKGMQTLNVRLVSGKEDKWKDGRSYSSKKAHTDIWGDQPANTINFFLPVYGDLINTGVTFYGSDNFPEDLIRPIDDYSLGAHLLQNSVQYDIGFRKGYCTVADSLSLHKTMPAGGGARISLEFRALIQPHVASDVYTESERLNDYLPYEVWKEIGTTKIFTVEEELATFNQNDKPSETINALQKIKDL